MWAALEEVGGWRGEIWNRRKSGDFYPEMLSITALRDDNGDMMEVYLWSGKGKRHSPTILIVAHERELRLDKKFFKTILKSFEAAK